MRRRGQRRDVARQAPAGAPDPTGRRIAFVPAAAIGNGSLLVTLSARGELEGLFWPSVDGEQHLGTLRLGIADTADAEPVRWLDEAPFGGWQQRWEDDTCVLHTSATDGTVTVEVTDVVDPAEPVLLRRVRADGRQRLVVACHPELEGATRHGAAYVDPATGAVVFYRRRIALAIALGGDGPATPRGGVVSLEGSKLETEHAIDVLVHRAPFEGSVELAFEGEARLIVAFGESPDEVLALVRRTLALSVDVVEDTRRLHDTRVVSSSLPPEEEYRSIDGLERLYRRSLLVLETLTDRATGAVIAAPEMDPELERSGGYGFVWPRDLAYVALGLLAAGSHDAAAAALRWLARHRAPEGLWLQRYWCDGSLAPSWGLHQIDETGAALFAFEAAWLEREDEQLDAELWVAARDAAAFLTGFVDPGNDLLRASVDLWEQSDGQHTYSCAACVGGLRAAAAMAERHDPELAPRFHDAAARLAAAVERNLWSDEHGHYFRSLNVARVDDRGVSPGSAFDRLLPYPNRRVLTVDPVDARLDSSLLGLGWPFGVVDPAGERMRATAATVASALGAPGGGLRRQADDEYAGGNVWLIATLWHGLYARLAGDDDTHRRALAFTASRATALDLLPEQVLEDGTPAWVLPLAWSHAMLVLAARPELAVVGHATRGTGVTAS
jgi:glucoamylase